MEHKLYPISSNFQEDVVYEPTDVKEALSEYFGSSTVDFATEVAMTDFPQFKKMMSFIGYNIQGSQNQSSYGSVPGLVKMVLSLRYPFLANIDDIMNDKDIEPNDFCHIELFDMPIGWCSAFGLELLEDIKTILLSYGKSALNDYNILQVKEKFGTLHWYFSCSCEGEPTPWNILHMLNGVYEAVSEVCCIKCGTYANVYMYNGGWICPVCIDCRQTDSNHGYEFSEQIDQLASELGYRGNFVPFQLSRLIRDYLNTKDSRTYIGPLEEKCVVSKYSKDGKSHDEYPLDILKDFANERNLTLNVFEVVKVRDAVVAEDTRDCTFEAVKKLAEQCEQERKESEAEKEKEKNTLS